MPTSDFLRALSLYFRRQSGSGHQNIQLAGTEIKVVSIGVNQQNQIISC